MRGSWIRLIFLKLTTAELSHTLECEFTRFITETHAETGTINICAGLFMTLARREIERADGDPAAILAGTPPSELHHALRVALTLVERDTVPFLKREIGHRTALDYELSEPRAGESNDKLGRTAVAFYQALPRQLSDAIAAPPNLEKPSRRKKMDMIALARRFQTLKDDAKHVSLREIATLRRLALEMGKRFGLGERVFFLTMPELLSLDASNAAALQVLADGRQQIHDAFKSAPPLASSLTAGDIELGPLAARVTGTTNGTRVSGTGGAVGRAIFVNHAVAETGKPIQGFRDGDIIVAPLIHPAWLPEVIRAGGVVTTIGGWLSHMSIVAREHGVTMIIGVTGLAQIETGTMLRLNANGTIEITGQPNTGVCPWPPGRNNFQPKSVLTATTTGRAASTAMAAEFPQFDRTKTNGFGLNSLNGNALQSG